MNETNENKSNIPSIIILIILVLSAVAAPLSLNKVSPIAPNLMEYFKIGETKLGILISVFSVAGIFLAIPGGIMIRKYGHWKCILLALLALLIGSIIGMYSYTFTLLLISRIIEGVGMALISIAAPSIIGAIVSSKRKGVAMGLFSSYFGIGQVLIFNIAPRIITNGGWRSVWQFCIIYIIIFTVLWILLLLRINAFSENKITESEIPTASFYAVLKNKSLWHLSISMCFYIMSYTSIQTFLPSYLSSVLKMNIAKASNLVGTCCLIGTVFCLFAGIISDKLSSRRILGGLALIISAGLFALIPITPIHSFTFLIIVLGLIPPILPVCVYAAATEVINDKSDTGIAIGLISMGQNVGFTVGPILFGSTVQKLGWNSAFIVMMLIAFFGGLFMLINKKVR